MAQLVQAGTGARDFDPADKRLQKHMFAAIRRVVEQFGYEEYDAPLHDSAEPYLAAPSPEQLGSGIYPLRWYSLPNLWQHEQPRQGKLREHWQLYVHLFGVHNLLAETEVIQVITGILKTLGATHDMYSIRLNSRRLMDFILHDYLGLDGVQERTMLHLVARMHDLPREDFLAEVDALFTPSQREAGATNKLIGVLKTKTLDNMPEAIRHSSPVLELKELIHLLRETRIANVRFDSTITRGVEEYGGMVFEVFDERPDGARQVLRGGRFEHTSGQGTLPVPVVGLRCSDVKLQQFLAAHDLLPPARSETDVYIALFGPVYAKAQRVIDDMRDMGANVAVDITGAAPEAQIAAARSKGIHYIMFISEKELRDEQYAIQNLTTGVTERHSAARIVSIVQDYRGDRD